MASCCRVRPVLGSAREFRLGLSRAVELAQADGARQFLLYQSLTESSFQAEDAGCASWEWPVEEWSNVAVRAQVHVVIRRA